MYVENLNDFIVTLKKGGMPPNTVLHNVIIIAQFCKLIRDAPILILDEPSSGLDAASEELVFEAIDIPITA